MLVLASTSMVTVASSRTHRSSGEMNASCSSDASIEEVGLCFAERWHENRVPAVAKHRAVDRPQQWLGGDAATDGDLISALDLGRIVDENAGPAIE